MSKDLQLYVPSEPANLMENFRHNYLTPVNNAEVSPSDNPSKNKNKPSPPRKLDYRGHQLLQRLLLGQGYETICEGKTDSEPSGWKKGTLYARLCPTGSIDVLVEGNLNQTSLGEEGDYTYLKLDGPAEYALFNRHYSQLGGATFWDKFKYYGLGTGGGVGLTVGLVGGGFYLNPLVGILAAVLGISLVLPFSYLILSTILENKIASPYKALQKAFPERYALGAELAISKALGLPVPEEEKPAQ